MASARQARLCDFVLASVSLSGLAVGNAADRCVHLGRFMQALSREPVVDFGTLMTETILSQRVAKLRHASLAIMEDNSVPDTIKHHFQQYCEATASSASVGLLSTPADIRASDPEAALKTSQAYIGQFGALLEAWPDLWLAAEKRHGIPV